MSVLSPLLLVGDDALLVFIRRLARADDLVDLKLLFNRAEGVISGIIKAITDHLLPLARRRLDKFDAGKWRPWMPTFASATTTCGSPLDRLWGLLDGTWVAMSRPGREGYRGDFQRVYYSGYKHAHGLLYQGVFAPNGLFVELDGPYPGGLYNDVSMLRESGLLDRIRASCYINGELYYLFGDCGYMNDDCLICPYPKATARASREARDFNRRMSKIRVPIEWGFGRVRALFPFVDYSHKLRFDSMPVGSYYIIAVFLTNLYCCLHGSQTAQYFTCPAPEIEDYMRIEDYML